MSDFTELAVISFLGLGAVLVLWCIARITNEMGNPVLTGFMGDHPIATIDRWLMLYYRFLVSAFGVVSFGAFVGLAMMMMGDHAGDKDTKLLAYVFAFLSGFVCISWSVHGVSMVVRCRSVLRQAEAD
jgi:hypothetical protein